MYSSINIKNIFNTQQSDSQRIDKISKGVACMDKKLTNYIYDCCLSFAEFKDGEGYFLDFFDLPELEQDKIISMIIVSEPELAHEAFGEDNDDYDRFMIPALMSYMSNPHDKDREIDFVQKWKEGAKTYLKSFAQKKIDEVLADYISEQISENPQLRYLYDTHHTHQSVVTI